MENGSESFKLTYSAKQQEEIKKIRKKYTVGEEDKMEQLRRLDASVTGKAQAVSLAVGIIGALLFGIGLSCIMALKGVWFIPGIIAGVIGMAVLSLAYPLYNLTLKKEREKIAPEILRLTDELLK